MDSVCSKNDIYLNPDKLPIDKLFLDYKTVQRTASKIEKDLSKMAAEIAGNLATIQLSEQWSNLYQIKVQKRPALDACWIESSHLFSQFQPYYPQFDDAENDDFERCNEKFAECLTYFAERANFHQLWCGVVFEPRFAGALCSFLNGALSPYDVLLLSTPRKKLYEKIYTLVRNIYVRLLTFKVSETEFIDKNIARTYLRKSEIVNARTVYLLCFLYSGTDPSLVKKLMEFYFFNQHSKELTEMLIDIVRDMEFFEEIRAPTIFKNAHPKTGRFDASNLQEISLHMFELAFSLNKFLEIYPLAIETAFELELPNRIPPLYKKLFGEMSDANDNFFVDANQSRCSQLAERWLIAGRLEYIVLFHKFIDNLLKKMSESRRDDQLQLNLETYVELISVSLDDDIFVRDYNLQYSIQEQLTKLRSEISCFDSTQADYLLTGLSKVNKKTRQKTKFVKVAVTSDSKCYQTCDFWDEYESIYDTLTQYLQVWLAAPFEKKPGPSTSGYKAKARPLPEPVIIALRQYSRLKRYFSSQKDNFETSQPVYESLADINKPSEDEIEQRVKKVLEMLPHLESLLVCKCLERLDYKPERVISFVLDGNLPADLKKASAHLDNYLMDTNRLKEKETKCGETVVATYFGKKPNYSEAKDMLDEKCQDIKSLVLQAVNNYDLDDDYDDRNQVSYYSRQDESDLLRRRIKLSNESEESQGDASSNSPSSDDDDSRLASRDAFCENPAVVRARREEQRARGYKGAQSRNRDLIGKPKGQGQEAGVQHNRNAKNVHKSTRANHARKSGAQWKRSRGMMPS